jgi:hypothetical protein
MMGISKRALLSIAVAVIGFGLASPDVAECANYTVTIQPNRTRAFKGAGCVKPEPFKMAFSRPSEGTVSFLKTAKRFNRKKRAVYTVRDVDDGPQVGRIMKAIFRQNRIKVTEVAYSIPSSSPGRLSLKKLPRCQFVFSGVNLLKAVG